MLTVAYATSDGTAVDQHFGWCERFDVYRLTPDDAVLVDSRVPADVDGVTSRIEARVDLLRDCAILHVTSIGGAAAAKVINARIHPLKVVEGTGIEELNTRLSAVLGGTPPPWMRKVLRSHTGLAAPVWSPR